MEEIDGKCQLCEHHEETIGHLTSGCSILTNNEHLIKHNKFANICTTQYAKPLALKYRQMVHTHAQASIRAE